MEDNLTKIFKSFKAIEPQQDYISRSKRLILLSSQKLPVSNWLAPIFKSSFALIGGLAIVVAALAFSVGGIALKGKQDSSLASLKKSEIQKEINDLEINVKLNPVRYFNPEQIGQASRPSDEINDILDKISL